MSDQGCSRDYLRRATGGLSEGAFTRWGPGKGINRRWCSTREAVTSQGTKDKKRSS